MKRARLPRAQCNFQASEVLTGAAWRPTRPLDTCTSEPMIPRSPAGSKRKVPGGNYGALTDGSPLPMDRGSYTGPGPYSSFSAGGMPCQRPPWGRLYAINANTGDIAWKVTLGINERLPKDKQNVGAISGAGPTVTAGGLVFAPTNDAYFHALDSKTGNRNCGPSGWTVEHERESDDLYGQVRKTICGWSCGRRGGRVFGAIRRQL